MPFKQIGVGFIAGAATSLALVGLYNHFHMKSEKKMLITPKKNEPVEKKKVIEKKEEKEKKEEVKNEKPLVLPESEDEDEYSPEEIERLNRLLDKYDGESFKMVLCVRNDLGMQKGKMCAQCAHAALGAYEEAMCRDDMEEIVDLWEFSGCAKIALKVNSQEELEEIEKDAEAKGLNHYLVCDAGRTQVAPGSLTVCAVGPAIASKIDEITGPKGSHPLKLL
ncbi:hypothetical protein WA158_005200 [Blastocystis sp. Blastoise]